jgi:uncharacterized RDD family membrane protein YckC
LPAFVFDVALRAVLIGLLIFLLMMTFAALGGTVGVLFAAFAYIAFFLLSWFYGIYFESRFNGRTPGKMLFRLRVISVDGRPINAVQAALRNLLRLADMNVLLSLQFFDPDAPPAFIIPTLAVGLVVMTITRRMQRIGDLAAGTMVVSEHSSRSPWHLQPDDLRAYGLAELIPATYPISSSLAQTVGMYMENRRRLGPGRRLEVAKHVSDPLIKKFELLPDTSPDLLLCALYVRIFLSEAEQAEGRERLRAVPLNRPGVDPRFHQPLHQPLGQQLNQPLGQSVSPPASQSASPPVSPPVSQPISQPISQPSAPPMSLSEGGDSQRSATSSSEQPGEESNRG